MEIVDCICIREGLFRKYECANKEEQVGHIDGQNRYLWKQLLIYLFVKGEIVVAAFIAQIEYIAIDKQRHCSHFENAEFYDLIGLLLVKIELHFLLDGPFLEERFLFMLNEHVWVVIVVEVERLPGVQHWYFRFLLLLKA